MLGDICPPRYNGGDRRALGFTWLPDADGPGRTALIPGLWGDSLLAGWHRAIATLVASGLNAVVDHILQEPDWLSDCAAAWHGLPVLFVGVRCPLAVAEAREAARAGAIRGYARWSYDRVHRHGAYDIEVDTSELNPEACAAAILGRLYSGAPLTAFPK